MAGLVGLQFSSKHCSGHWEVKSSLCGRALGGQPKKTKLFLVGILPPLPTFLCTYIVLYKEVRFFSLLLKTSITIEAIEFSI